MQIRRLFNLRTQWSDWNRAERTLIVQAIGLLHITPIAMRIFGMQRWLNLLGQWTPITPSKTITTPTELKQVHWLNVQAVNHSPVRGACLSRSINLWWLMRRRHIDTEIRIGVRGKGDKFRAHAWLEYQGQPINAGEQTVQRFTLLDYSIVKGDIRF